MTKEIINIKDIAVGIVIYNPNIDILSKCIEQIYNKTNRIFLFDNASNNQEQIDSLVKAKYKRACLIKNKNNIGLGYAYNMFFEKALDEMYQWVMLLDQDSICAPGLIDEYRKYINTDINVGMYTCIHKDRNLSESNFSEFIGKFRDVKRCITAASIMHVNAYKDGCKYDESFFIDKLDYDMCYSLTEKGYNIRQINYIGLSQEIGHSEEHRFFGRWITVYNHSPQRRYYMARNGILLSKKHKQRSILKSISKEVVDIFFVLIYERNLKKEKFIAFSKGIIDGLLRGI